MKCNDIEPIIVCLTSSINGERFSAVAHYEYGKDTFGNSILVATRYTNAEGSVVYDPATVASARPGACPEEQTATAAEQFDTESYCYVTTATPEPRSGWARHQDSFVGNPNNFPNVSPAGIAYFDGVGNPVNISEPGFDVVPCASSTPPDVPEDASQYTTTYQDVAQGETLTITPGTNLISWVVRNRSGTENTLQVNGGQILILDRDEVAASGGIDEERSTLTDTVSLDAVSGPLRVMILRRV